MDGTFLGQQSPPYTYPNPTRNFSFFSTFFFFIFIEIKCFSEVIWDLKRRDRTRVESQIDCCTHLRH